MQDKVATVRRLMREGYELEDIESEGRCIQATFRLAGQRRTVRLFPSDAERLLFPPGFAAFVRIRR